jgi:hypothetical protein
MIRLQRYYLGYRRIGFNRLDALRFAWMVVTAGVKPIPVRSSTSRRPEHTQ